MARFDMDAKEFDRLQQAIKNFPGSAEDIINDVFHNEGGALIQERITRLMPVSGKYWNGKSPPAKLGKSLRQENSNLAVTVRTTSAYHYLYFPDDGTNTRNHVGNQQFFRRGGESSQSEIVDRCISRLVTDFEKAI